MSAQPESSSALSPAGREPLEAILLVGGQGTRLRPLTIGTPVMYIACRSSAAGASARWSKLIATPVSKIN